MTRVYSTWAWRKATIAAKERDGYRCVACGRGWGLDVDHIIPVNDAPHLAYVLDNLRTLCRKCHNQRTHGKRAPKRRNSRQW